MRNFVEKVYVLYIKREHPLKLLSFKSKEEAEKYKTSDGFISLLFYKNEIPKPLNYFENIKEINYNKYSEYSLMDKLFESELEWIENVVVPIFNW